MVARCTNEKNTRYKYYGARGIKVCKEWLDVKKFIEDMYPTFSNGMSIDRIDNESGYSKKNCRWTTKEVQSRNTRKIRSNNTSGYRGVHYCKNARKWRTTISVDSKRICLGFFNTVEEAGDEYDRYVIENILEHTINGRNKCVTK